MKSVQAFLSSEDNTNLFTTLEKKAYEGKASLEAVEFARFICRFSNDFSNSLIFAAYLTFSALYDSHTCLGLNAKFLLQYVAEKELEWFWKDFIEYEKFISEITSSSSIGKAEELKPLILEDNRLYIHRYREYEKYLSKQIIKRAKYNKGLKDSVFDLAEELFPKGAISPDWQKIAALNAASRGFAVISGGPGTGKTRTIAGIVALILENEMEKDHLIALCAPTGKAAARLTESFNRAVEELGLNKKFSDKLPEKAFTIHRLLGVKADMTGFRHNREKPLIFDTVVVDEASMVDLPLMVHLIEAMKDETRFILVGDKDQLASVEAGSVFSDICKEIDSYSYSREFMEISKKGGYYPKKTQQNSLHILKDSIVTLTHNYRFNPQSGIHELANAVNAGDFEKAQMLLCDEKLKGIAFFDDRELSLSEFLEEKVSPFLNELTKEIHIPNSLLLLQRFKVLCAIKEGPLGNISINNFISKLFLDISSPFPIRHELFHKLPIIIRENDYNIKLFNGDTGILWQEEQDSLRAYFYNEEEIRKIAISRLPRFEPAWAITVHVSQGSEYDNVFFVLPPSKSLMANRQLLYTAITRAKERIFIWGSKDSLKKAIETEACRQSGLADRLWMREE